MEVQGGHSPLESKQAVNSPYLLTRVDLLAAQPLCASPALICRLFNAASAACLAIKD